MSILQTDGPGVNDGTGCIVNTYPRAAGLLPQHATTSRHIPARVHFDMEGPPCAPYFLSERVLLKSAHARQEQVPKLASVYKQAQSGEQDADNQAHIRGHPTDMHVGDTQSEMPPLPMPSPKSRRHGARAD